MDHDRDHNGMVLRGGEDLDHHENKLGGCCEQCGQESCRCCPSCHQKQCTCCGEDFTVLEGRDLATTVISALTPCVDSIRDIYTQFGARPYTVSLVWTRWSSGTRGRGVEEVVAIIPVLPTPKVQDLAALSRDVLEVGTDEVGNIRVSEISPRFNEDELLGRGSDGTPIPGDQSFYWEVYFPRPSSAGVRRRFTPKGVPNYAPTKFQWWIDLEKAYEDRSRGGDVRG